MESFNCQETLRVPHPEKSFAAPLLLVVDEKSLKADVYDPAETEEKEQGRCLLESDHISTIAANAAHPSQWAMVAHELTPLNTTALYA